MMNVKGQLKKDKFTFSKIFIHLVLGGFCLACVIPIYIVIVVSFTPEMEILTRGYPLFPEKFSLAAYKFIFSDPTQILRSYGVSIVVTIAGTLLGLWLTATIAYAISRKDYRYRNVTSFLIFFTMLFNGGLTPFYIIVTQVLHLSNSIFALILPLALQGWFVLLMKGFLQSIPISIIESAKIDGSSEFKAFTRIVLPTAKPGLATIGLFLMLTYWNDWYMSLLFINDNRFVSLQYLMYRIMSNINMLRQIISSHSSLIKLSELPSLSARMAMCLLAAGPMLIVFVFFQKYFIKGITVGSIKG